MPHMITCIACSKETYYTSKPEMEVCNRCRTIFNRVYNVAVKKKLINPIMPTTGKEEN